MGSKSHVSRWGSSLAVRIPKHIAEQLGIQEGSSIEISFGEDQLVLRKASYDLADMLDRINADNMHASQHFDAAFGNEEW